jgi:Fic-DOC domain mobile mystery protein B
VIDDPEYIEGQTPLDPDELDGLKHPHVTTRGELDQLEQANIENGLVWLGRQRSPDILTDGFVRKLHKELLGDVWTWAGSYRLTEKTIGIDPPQISVQIRTLLEDVRYWVVHETYPPIEAAIRFHHRLVSIHPFANGNGRFSRIMADVLLEDVFDAGPIDWAGGYELQHMNDRRQQYIAALRAADAGDYAPLFQFVGYMP